jgi:hypothetical protein
MQEQLELDLQCDPVEEAADAAATSVALLDTDDVIEYRVRKALMKIFEEPHTFGKHYPVPSDYVHVAADGYNIAHLIMKVISGGHGYNASTWQEALARDPQFNRLIKSIIAESVTVTSPSDPMQLY